MKSYEEGNVTDEALDTISCHCVCGVGVLLPNNGFGISRGKAFDREHAGHALADHDREVARRAWFEGATSRQCRCNAYSEGECACGMWPSERNPYDT